jgi:hypothetical protein
MKLASRAGRGGAAFAPLPRRRRLTPPDPAERLAALAGDVADGAETALALVDALGAWRVRADAAVADLSGRTAPRLVEALTGAVALTTNDLVAACAASKAAVCRNLAILTQRGVVREISGQARYQVWAAAV